MRTLVLRALVALALAGIPGIAACEWYECVYGGAGCSAPGISGPCDGRLVLGRTTEGTFVYYDDTGAHGARVESVHADAAVLTLQRVSGGRFLLTGVSLGTATVEAVIDGWPEPQRFDLEVVAQDSIGADGALCDAGPCTCRDLRAR